MSACYHYSNCTYEHFHVIHLLFSSAIFIVLTNNQVLTTISGNVQHGAETRESGVVSYERGPPERADSHDSRATILLQTAKVTVCDAAQPNCTPTLMTRAILDTGSQRSYVTTRVKEAIQAKRSHCKSMIIKTFGSEWGEKKTCEVIELKVATTDGEFLTLPVVVVPHICDPVHTCSVDTATTTYSHLRGLELADPVVDGSDLEINILIGSDHYWKVVTGRVVRGESRPIAIETRLGWILSGPSQEVESTVINFAATHSSRLLRLNSVTDDEDLDAGLKKFWDLESLGILKEEHPVRELFSQRITFENGRYQVHLPWKQSHPPLPDNYDLCRRRLGGLMKRLSQNPERLRLYNSGTTAARGCRDSTRACRAWRRETTLSPTPRSLSTRQKNHKA